MSRMRIASLCLAFFLAAVPVAAADGRPPEKFAEPRGLRGRLDSVGGGVITVRQGDNDEVFLSLDLADNVPVRVGWRPASLAELKKNQPVVLALAGDRRTVAAIWAAGKRLEGTVARVDAESRQLTMTRENGQSLTCTVPADSPIYIDHYRSRLMDLKDCDRLRLELAADDRTAGMIQAWWWASGDPRGRIEAVNAGLRTVTLKKYDANGEPAGSQTFQIADTAKLYANGKPVELADLRPGWEAAFRCQAFDKVVGIRAVIRPTD